MQAFPHECHLSRCRKLLKEFTNKVECKYRYFTRHEGFDDKNIIYQNWTNLKDGKALMEQEFVEVECNKKGSLIGGSYVYQWSTVIPKKRNLKGLEILEESEEHPSVIMIGLDSMSRGNFIRQLPETYKFLEKNGFIDLLSHVKVMDNTYGNWLAIMAGKSGTSTKEFPSELPDEWNLWFDDFDLIWKHFTKENYVTFFAEDRPDIATFNYFGYLNGFKHAPTDHYFRPFWISCYWSLTFRRSTTGCYDAIPLHKIQLNYLEKFLKEYEKKRKFVWWWTQDLSHDSLNSIGVVDFDLKDFLQRNMKFLEKSIVIVFSDHGHRYASIRETMVGRLEARLPFLSIKIPDNLKKEHPWIVGNLKRNSNFMTTQYDLHKTLLQIAQGKFSEEKDPRDRNSTQRAFSLFKKVSQKRTCREAHVPEDYCPCFEEFQIPLSEAQKPAEVLLEYVNKLTEDYDNVDDALVNAGKTNSKSVQETEAEENQEKNVIKDKKQYYCAKLELKEIQFASVKLPPQRLVKDPQVKDKVVKTGMEISYRVTVLCKEPSNAVIEGVVVNNLDSGVWEATGEIERNNKYGNSSVCVADRVLKKICHCIPSG
ncbi:hypothetical protein FO519_001185 [Halicephalobus sp. NKZ332]|nr:hypothetical protein FO519_001185 [Halicephalobus sp. NKZ332]